MNHIRRTVFGLCAGVKYQMKTHEWGKEDPWP